MKAKVSGIVTRTIKYKDTSIITDIFTDEFGLQSYIVNNIRSARSKVSIGLFQPLTLLSLVVYHNEEKSLKRISEVACPHPFQTIHSDIRKTAIAIFLAEFMSKVCRTTEPNRDLFIYIKNELISFDGKRKDYENFHLRFLAQLMKYLGFQPEGHNEVSTQLGLSFSEHESRNFDLLINNQEPDQLSYKERRHLLEAILDFYRLHIDGFSKMTSGTVLHEVLKND
jgi:DNA repair protein RecO (recombination protein O)